MPKPQTIKKGADAELSHHDPDVQHRDSLSAEERKVIGRLIEFLKTLGELDNTMIMVLSDFFPSDFRRRR